MKLIETELKTVYAVEPRVFEDDRGWFFESYSKIKTPEIECDFIQDNHSFSADQGVLRGIHFQNGASAQSKLVRCIKGAVLDVVVDLRKQSPTYKQWISVELSAENKKQLFIPKGFGHGFVTLTDNVEFLYKTDAYYDPAADRSILWSDPDLAIDWGITEPLLSKKDKEAPLLKDSDCSF